MKPTLLVYNIKDKKKVAGIKKSLLLLGIRGKFVTKDLYNAPIEMVFEGILPEAYEEYQGEELSAEMIVMGGFNNALIDKLIAAFYKNGVGRINLKAILTETNAKWNAIELFEELSEEHKRMSQSELGE